MRREFVEALVNEARRDERIVLLTGDLGFAVLEPFAEAFPDRFFNAGAAEQNMIGIATGLAEAGLTPYAYSIATFASMRPYEFIRNGPVLHELPVRIVGTGEGFDYGPNGMTHYSLEDLAIMRAQPGMAVVVPAASGQLSAAVSAIQALPGPSYLRLSKQTLTIPALDGRFEHGRAHQLAEGEDIALIAVGGMCINALEAAALLGDAGISAAVLAVSSLAPAPVEDLVAQLNRVPVAITVEAHYITGGLGSLVAEVIAENGLDCRLMRAGVAQLPAGITGSGEFMYREFGLTADRLADTAATAVAGRPA
jgi:transketolase